MNVLPGMLEPPLHRTAAALALRHPPVLHPHHPPKMTTLRHLPGLRLPPSSPLSDIITVCPQCSSKTVPLRHPPVPHPHHPPGAATLSSREVTRLLHSPLP